MSVGTQTAGRVPATSTGSLAMAVQMRRPRACSSCLGIGRNTIRNSSPPQRTT